MTTVLSRSRLLRDESRRVFSSAFFFSLREAFERPLAFMFEGDGSRKEWLGESFDVV